MNRGGVMDAKTIKIAQQFPFQIMCTVAGESSIPLPENWREIIRDRIGEVRYPRQLEHTAHLLAFSEVGWPVSDLERELLDVALASPNMTAEQHKGMVSGLAKPHYRARLYMVERSCSPDFLWEAAANDTSAKVRGAARRRLTELDEM